jgi:hypothetical protein
MRAEETVLDRIEARKLRWFGHVMRMPEERWPAMVYSALFCNRAPTSYRQGNLTVTCNSIEWFIIMSRSSVLNSHVL